MTPVAPAPAPIFIILGAALVALAFCCGAWSALKYRAWLHRHSGPPSHIIVRRERGVAKKLVVRPVHGVEQLLGICTWGSVAFTGMCGAVAFARRDGVLITVVIAAILSMVAWLLWVVGREERAVEPLD